MSWRIFHRLGSPKWFYDISCRCLPWLPLSAALLAGTGLSLGLLFAPPDYLQGNSYRIIFLHVPSAFLASAIYAMMAMAAVISLVWKIKLADIVLQCSAPVGASFCFLALSSGAIWGKPTWGTWWTWDARLTSVLILFFLYLGVMALRGAIQGTHASAKASSTLRRTRWVQLLVRPS